MQTADVVAQTQQSLVRFQSDSYSSRPLTPVDLCSDEDDVGRKIIEMHPDHDTPDLKVAGGVMLLKFGATDDGETERIAARISMSAGSLDSHAPNELTV